MIDADFIIRYTNGLYCTDSCNAPSYDEFRDMFSSGQIKSKTWLIQKLAALNILSDDRIIVVGAWYGTLGLMLKNRFPQIDITLLDIDPRCKMYIDNITYDIDTIHAVTKNMYDHKYDEYLVINTACEHIADIKSWLNTIPKGTYVALQSNNFRAAKGHINCIDRIQDFEYQTQLSEILFSGELSLPSYTRYMLIGRT